MHRSCWLLRDQPRQAFEWNYFPLLLTRRIVLFNKKKKILYSFFLKHFPKKKVFGWPCRIKFFSIFIYFELTFSVKRFVYLGFQLVYYYCYVLFFFLIFFLLFFSCSLFKHLFLMWLWVIFLKFFLNFFLFFFFNFFLNFFFSCSLFKHLFLMWLWVIFFFFSVNNIR